MDESKACVSTMESFSHDYTHLLAVHQSRAHSGVARPLSPAIRPCRHRHSLFRRSFVVRWSPTSTSSRASHSTSPVPGRSRCVPSPLAAASSEQHASAGGPRHAPRLTRRGPGDPAQFPPSERNTSSSTFCACRSLCGRALRCDYVLEIPDPCSRSLRYRRLISHFSPRTVHTPYVAGPFPNLHS